MVKALKKKNKLNLVIILSFILISIFEMVILLVTNKYILSSDTLYHLQRITGLSQATSDGHLFPHFNLWSMGQSGNAEFTMYPYITILPIVWLFKIVPLNITTFNVLMIMMLLLVLLIAFYSSKSIIKSIKRRYLFAILYGTCEDISLNIFIRGDFGVILVIALFPLVFFGMLNLIENNKWKELAWGLSLLVYTHVMGTVMAVLLILLMGLTNINKLVSKDKLKSILKAIILVALVSAYQIVPMIYLIANNKLQAPYKTYGFIGEPVLLLIVIIGFIGILGIVSGIWNYKKLGDINKKLFWIAIAFLLITSRLFPWQLLRNTPIKVIQFPYRLLIIPVIIFTYLLAININKHKSRLNKTWKLVMTIATAFVIQFDFQIIDLYSISTMPSNHVVSKPNLITNQGLIRHKYTYQEKQGSNISAYIDKNSQFKNILNYNWSDLLVPDYYTVGNQYKYGSKLRDRSYIGMQNGVLGKIGQGVKYIRCGNGTFIFRNKRYLKEIPTPVNKYNGINYNIKLDHKRVKYSKDKNNFLNIKNIKPGHHKVQIMDKPNESEYISSIISIGGLLLLFTADKKRKSHDEIDKE